jgi:hypothetical protein
LRTDELFPAEVAPLHDLEGRDRLVAVRTVVPLLDPLGDAVVVVVVAALCHEVGCFIEANRAGLLLEFDLLRLLLLKDRVIGGGILEVPRDLEEGWLRLIPSRHHHHSHILSWSSIKEAKVSFPYHVDY